MGLRPQHTQLIDNDTAHVLWFASTFNVEAITSMPLGVATRLCENLRIHVLALTYDPAMRVGSITVRKKYSRKISPEERQRIDSEFSRLCDRTFD